MALPRMWRRLRNYLRWKKAITPMLLNADTGELIPFSTYTAPPGGKWILHRPLTLSESTLPLYLEFPLIPGGVTVRKSAEVSNPPGHQVELQHNREAALPHTLPQQFV